MSGNPNLFDPNWMKARERMADALKCGLRDGDRVELANYVDRFPFFQVAPGATGTVTEASENLVTIKMDEFIDGCEEWDNEVIFNLPDDHEELSESVRVIA